MDDEALWAVIESERLSLADLLARLSPEQWEAQSLCSAWRVRDVAAHVAMAPHTPGIGSVLVGVLRARGDLWAYGRDLAIDYARRPTGEIVGQLRRDAASRGIPPLTNVANLHMDILVHGQDIAVPLGIDRPMPPAAAEAAFHRVWDMGWPFRARRRLAGLRLVATDADVAVGTGREVHGTLATLLLLMTGRTAAALPRLSGTGVADLQARA
ncbi:maleylpyruvate isomerase family mycothiol-dependent enzyme [Arthrobacter sp. E918]|uniref:Maleylpyruvate isomerase family mycothiol-dependent enzyme n=1 Tax=Arthrobacter mobilis TaxID=2724944 RepID=A0A7X6HC80_9MICC|nr:maleylpyruvate isomerase family mycothiol-dependent enzyme [Arthrobacter mobilis]